MASGTTKRMNALAVAALLLGCTAGLGFGDDKPALPVPRFVSIRFSEVRVRVGPGKQYPVAWLFQKQNLPVEITQEFDNWRKIRDPDGTAGWVNAAELQGRRFIVVEGAVRAVRGDPAADATVVARAEPGVVGRLDKCPPESIEWCEVEVGDVRGWLRRSEIWGVYPQETYPPP
jgi:SH3-like domain-containing protein